MHPVIDVASDISAKVGELRAAGVKTIVRYYNHANSQTLPTKRLEPGEAAAINDAGLSLMTVFQQRGGSGGNIQDLDGQSGKRDAERALELAGRVGQPKASAIYFAVDHDFYTQSDINKIKPYFERVAAALDGKYRVGIYGSGRIAQAMRDEGFVDLIWLAAAKGWSGTREMLKTSHWALFQQWPPKSWPDGSFTYDGNIVSVAWPDYGQFTLEAAATEETSVDGPLSIMQVNARNGLNLRRGPSNDFAVEDTLALGSIVYALEKHGEWVCVDLQGDGIADGFLHSDYLTAVSGGFPTPFVAGASPYDIALQELAREVNEVPGRGNNPRIVMYHRSTSAGAGTDDSVAWCSSFVNYCVEQAGLTGTDSQWARSWESWGHDVSDQPREGDIVVFSRKGRGVNGGHVGFLKTDFGSSLSVLGGNQSNRIRFQNYPKDGKLGGFDYTLLSVRRG